MSVEDMLEAEIEGVSWTDIRTKAFKLGADFFKVSEDQLELLPFMAAPIEQINDGSGARIRTTYQATVTIALKENNAQRNV